MQVSRWPQVALSAVPSDRIAIRLAEAVRQLAVTDQQRCDVDRLCQLGGFSYRSVPLESKSGGHEALLVPRVAGGFEIFVDPCPSVEVGERSRARHGSLWRRRLRFRVAHEIGHSFFYDRRFRPARRLLPATDAEEVFCDLFASALLLPQGAVEGAPLTPDAVIKLADKFDVSVEATGRAFARCREGTSVWGLRLSQRGQSSVKTFEVLWSSGPATPPRHPARGVVVNLNTTEDEQCLRLDSGKSYRTTVARLGATYFVATLQATSTA